MRPLTPLSGRGARAGSGLPLFAAAPMLAVAYAVAAVAAKGAAGGEHAPSEALLIAQIVLLILTGKLLGEGLARIGQPAVMGQLVAGVLLGKSVFGLLWPAGHAAVFPDDPGQRAMLNAVAQVGVLLLLLLAGMETDVSLVRKAKRAAVAASLASIAIPFAAGFLFGRALPESLLPDPKHRLIASLFLGTVLSISSVKIVATVIRQMDFMRRNVGQIILASAIIDDTIAWIIIAVNFGLAEHGSVDLAVLVRSVVGTLLFLALSLTLGRRLVFRIIRAANDHFSTDAAVVAAILVMMGAMALATNAIGVRLVLGAFVAGILVGRSPILTREIDGQIRGITEGLFMPVFFGAAGLYADMSILRDPRLAALTGAMLLIACGGKAAGAFTGGWLGGLRTREAAALAAGLNARGSTEIIVATIGVSLGVLSQDLFTMIVTLAFVTTMLMPPTLRWALRRLPMGEEERKRLEREAFEEKGFVPGIERVLVTKDGSPSGELAARLAGLLAGRRGTPVTVLQLSEGGPPEGEGDTGRLLEAATSALKSAAEEASPPDKEQEDSPPKVEISAQIPQAPPGEAVRTEAAKGYHLLVIGLEPATSDGGAFAPVLSEVAGAFEGPLGIVVARAALREAPSDAPLEVLVPITGSGVSRRGAEVALALAQAASAPITALAIASSDAQSEAEERRSKEDDAEILREVARLSEFFDVEVNRQVGEGDRAQAIQSAARDMSHCLIVLGVSRRSDESLSFGNLAASLVGQSEHSVLLVSS